MVEFITILGVGILICVIGIINMTGNIASLHWYHRRRVSEEDRKPFGKLVGLGTLIIGVGLSVFGTLNFISSKTQLALLALIGTAVLVVFVVLGLALTFYAMIKYNKGIF